MEKLIEKFLIPYLFITSQQPVLFQDFLKGNKMYNDGLLINGDVLGFRLRLFRAYVVYIIIVNIFLLLLTALVHSVFKQFDLHILIISTMMISWIIFAFFSIFKEFIIDKVSLMQIKKAWQIHLPLFDFEKHSAQVARIYSQAQEEHIHKNDMQRYIIDNIITK